ncbi:anaphase-promoting complex subunit 5 isoform X2 [Cucumis melo var. makuwa]|uniref:Anaphase-promoting complex subunit 5 n=1 Tax=Cucumis melo var. makuwa TaxID=1194695 RepID=A0A5D3CY91_CUCMM|nr:anaphase-promoting complex subunit 5 isoform X2 [Cucumis melo var. makuwa]
MAGIFKSQGGFAVTPHKVSVCILLQIYAPPAQISVPFPFSSVAQHNRLGLFLLALTKSCDDILEPKLEELINQLREVGGLLDHWLIDHLTSRLSSLASPDDLFNFFSEMRGILGGPDSGVVEDDQIILDPNSNLGMFLRRCVLAFNVLSFEGVCHLLTNIGMYCKETLSNCPYGAPELDDTRNDLETLPEYESMDLENLVFEKPQPELCALTNYKLVNCWVRWARKFNGSSVFIVKSCLVAEFRRKLVDAEIEECTLPNLLCSLFSMTEKTRFGCLKNMKLSMLNSCVSYWKEDFICLCLPLLAGFPNNSADVFFQVPAYCWWSLQRKNWYLMVVDVDVLSFPKCKSTSKAKEGYSYSHSLSNTSRDIDPSGSAFLRTNWQMQGYLDAQAEKIEKFGSLFSLNAFELVLKQLQKMAPELHRVHFLRYLNTLYHDDYFSALENVHRYFDYSAGTEGFDFISPGSGCNSFGRYEIALLCLGMMHVHFGHPKQALEVLTEAVHVSQQQSNDTCLAYTLAAIGNLLSESGFSRTSGILGSSYSPLMSMGISLSVQQQLFVLLTESLRRAESLKLKRLVASNHLAMAKFHLMFVAPED